MKITDAIVIWTPGNASWAPEAERGQVRLERRGTRWERTLGDLWMPATALGEIGETTRTEGKPDKQLLAMFLLFHSITVRDAVPIAMAHEAFLGIDEYRRTISRDIKGAED